MSFPIDALLPALQQSLQAHPRLVLEAPPGAGKTTQVPPALLDAEWLAGRRIVMLEPRRVAARAAAGFMAARRGEPIGETVGYRIRFEHRVSARTRIEVVTEGILTRMIQDDPMLEGVGALVFDEFHERHLAGDLGLALALDVQAQLREDLRIVVMSATLDGEALARRLDAPRLASAGRSFPVQVAHFAAQRDEALEVQVRRAVSHALHQHPGDVLVFLPGQREMARVEAGLQAATGRHAAPGPGAASATVAGDTVVLTLHGELPVERQAEALQPDPQGRRRVILATNVAESSVTLPGVRVVIDTGLAREPRYDPNSGFPRLEVVPVSQASADQRAGRAGRVAEGWAYRLWPQSQRLEAQRRPEIAQVELAGLLLELAAWGSVDLCFVDPPPVGALAAARELLRRLGALDAADTITALGRRMLTLGTHPRLAAMLLAPMSSAVGRATCGHGDAGTLTALACDLAALLEARDPLRGAGDDLAARWRALAAFRHGRLPADAHRAALATVDATARQWRRRLDLRASPPTSVDAHVLGHLLTYAFPDRIACQRPGDPYRYQLANGRSAALADDSTVFGQPWIAIADLRHAARDARVLRAAPLQEAQLREDFPDRFRTVDQVRWDVARRALVSLRETRFDGIVLDSRPAGRVDPAIAAVALTDAVAELGLDELPWTPALRQWRERVQSLREWMPEQAAGLPDMSDAALMAGLHDWLQPAFAGKTRLDALAAEELAQALQSQLDWELRRRVDAWAPVRIRVPSGLERTLEYRAGESPVLAVKLQELFGLADTPRIAEGRVALTLQLLSPAGRPLQVTQDLRGFWERTYPEVRKEMKGRYPRHPWPEDPWSATATHRAKPRGT